MVAEPALERLADRPRLALPDEHLGEMPSPDGVRGDRERLVLNGHAERPQSLDHLPKARDARSPHVGEGRIERGAVIDEVPEQVDLAPQVFRRDLDAGDDFERGRGCRPRCRNPGERVVVGDRDGREAAAAGEVHDLLGAIGAVARGGVQVQVGAARLGAACERLAQVSKGGSRGHQGATLSTGADFFAAVHSR